LLCTLGRKTQFYFAGPIVKLACILFSLSFTCIAALGIYCPTTKRLLQSSTDSTRQIQTLASSQLVEGGAEDRATAHRNDPIAANGWRFHVNIRFGVALNVAEGANTARALVHATVVLLLAIAAGCTGFVTVSPFLLGLLTSISDSNLHIECCGTFCDVARSLGTQQSSCDHGETIPLHAARPTTSTTSIRGSPEKDGACFETSA